MSERESMLDTLTGHQSQASVVVSLKKGFFFAFFLSFFWTRRFKLGEVTVMVSFTGGPNLV